MVAILPHQYLNYILWIAVISLMATYSITPACILLGRRTGLVDIPSQRRIHINVIPRTGGLALIFGFYCGIWAVWLLGIWQYNKSINTWLEGFFFSSAIIILLGLWDDRASLSSPIKMLGQFIAAVVFYNMSGLSVNSIMGHYLSQELDFLLTIFWFLAFTNAFNLIDGLDGLCAGITAISSIGLAISLLIGDQLVASMVCFGLAGAAIGLLYYNFHPARVFLGDTGSMFCGFTLAAIALQSSAKSTFLVTFGVPLLAAGVPAIDTMLAIWRRSVRSMIASGNSSHHGGVMTADLEHIHHRLLGYGLNQRQVALILYLATLVCVVMGLLSILGSRTGLGLFLILFTACAYTLVKHVAHIELWDTARLLLRNVENTSRRGYLSLFFYPVWDLIWLTISVFIVYCVLFKLTLNDLDVQDVLPQLAIFLICPYISIIVTNTYSKIWFHAIIRDYIELALTINLGGLLSLASILFLQQDITYFWVTHALLFCSISTVGIVGIRIITPFFRQWMLTTRNHNAHGVGKPVNHVLLYGGGRRCGIFMRKLHMARQLETEGMQIVGIIDDSPFLRKRLVHGLRVLGGFSELEAAVDNYHIEQVIITADLKEDIILQVKELLAKKNIVVSFWCSELVTLCECVSAR